eukprot:1626603-Pleurochrysis_carterae.AAC.1
MSMCGTRPSSSCNRSALNQAERQGQQNASFLSLVVPRWRTTSQTTGIAAVGARPPKSANKSV